MVILEIMGGKTTCKSATYSAISVTANSINCACADVSAMLLSLLYFNAIFEKQIKKLAFNRHIKLFPMLFKDLPLNNVLIFQSLECVTERFMIGAAIPVYKLDDSVSFQHHPAVS